MCVYDRFPFLETEATKEGVKENAEWATNLNIADYPDKCVGSFVWEVVESNDHNTLVDAKSFFGFVPTARIKVETPSLDQLIAAKKPLDNHVLAAGINNERGAWKRFYKKKLNEREGEYFYNLSKTKDRIARDNE